MSRFVNQRRDERFKSDLAIRIDQGEGTVRDLSASGIYFLTDVRLKHGDTLNFSLEFQNTATGPLLVKGTARVVRSEKHAGGNGVAASITGMQFVRIPKPAND